MWELDYKESWVPKNWCFWAVVVEKTLESPLDCKEIQPVNPKGEESWVLSFRPTFSLSSFNFIRRLFSSSSLSAIRVVSSAYLRLLIFLPAILIPVELFQILKDDAVKVLYSICHQIWKNQQWPQDWKRSVFIPIPKKGNAKECSNYCTIALISHASKVMLKIPQARLQQYVNHELPDVQAGFR